MRPLNEKERNQKLRQFVGMMAGTIGLAALAIFFGFRYANASSGQDSQCCSDGQEQMNVLFAKNSIVPLLEKIYEADKSLESKLAAGDYSGYGATLNDISTNIEMVRKTLATMKAEIETGKSSSLYRNNQLTAALYDKMLADKEGIKKLREQLQNCSASGGGGNAAAELASVKKELEAAKKEAENAGKSGDDAKDALKDQIGQLKDQVADCKSNRRAWKNTATSIMGTCRDLRNKLEGSEKKDMDRIISEMQGLAGQMN